MKIDLNSRKLLQALRSEADRMEEGTTNPSWKKTYQRLSNVADHLDAMIARTEVVVRKER